MIHASIRIVVSDAIRGEALDVLRCLKEPTEVQNGCRGCRILQGVDDGNALTCVARCSPCSTEQPGCETADSGVATVALGAASIRSSRASRSAAPPKNRLILGLRPMSRSSCSKA